MKKILIAALGCGLLLSRSANGDTTGQPLAGPAVHLQHIAGASALPSACKVSGEVCLWYDSNTTAFKLRLADTTNVSLGTIATSMTSGRMPVATGATTLGDSNFTASGNVFDLASSGVLQVGNSNVTDLVLHGNQPVTSGTGASNYTFAWQNSNKEVLELWIGTFDASTGTTGMELDTISPLDGTTYLGGIKWTDKETMLWAPNPGYVSQETSLSLPNSGASVNNVLWTGRNNFGGVASLWGRWWATPHAIEFDAFDPTGGVFDPTVGNVIDPGIYFGMAPTGDETDMWSVVVGGNQAGIGLKSDGTANISVGLAASPTFINFTHAGGIQLPATGSLESLSTTVPMTLRSDVTLNTVTTNSFSANPFFTLHAGTTDIFDVNAGGGGVELDLYDPRDGITNNSGIISSTGAGGALKQLILFHDATTALSTAAVPDAQSIFNIAVNPGFAGASKHAFETWVATPSPTAGNAILAFSIADGTTLLGNIGFTSLGAQFIASDGTTMVQALDSGSLEFDSVAPPGSKTLLQRSVNAGNSNRKFLEWSAFTTPNHFLEMDIASQEDGTSSNGGFYFESTHNGGGFIWDGFFAGLGGGGTTPAEIDMNSHGELDLFNGTLYAVQLLADGTAHFGASALATTYLDGAAIAIGNNATSTTNIQYGKTYVQFYADGGFFLDSTLTADLGTPNLDSPQFILRGKHFSEGGGVVNRDNFIKNQLTNPLGGQEMQFHEGAYDFYMGDPGYLYIPPFGGIDSSSAGTFALGGNYATGVSLFPPLAYEPQDNTVGATFTIDATRPLFRQTLTSATNVTAVTVSAGLDGQLMTVQIIQPGAGTPATVVTTWTNVSFNGGAGSFTATLGKHDTYSFIYNQAAAKWSEVSRSLNQTN